MHLMDPIYLIADIPEYIKNSVLKDALQNAKVCSWKNRSANVYTWDLAEIIDFQNFKKLS